MVSEHAVWAKAAVRILLQTSVFRAWTLRKSILKNGTVAENKNEEKQIKQV